MRELDRRFDKSCRRREPAEPERLAVFDAGRSPLEGDAQACGILDGDLDGRNPDTLVTLPAGRGGGLTRRGVEQARGCQ